MTQRDNILQELIELKSTLAAISKQNIFQVPGGYFDELAIEIMEKVRALETSPEEEHLNSSSPLFRASKQTPFSSPPRYFDELAEKILKIVKSSEATNAADELASLSPLLSSISKQNLYAAPVGYFNTLDKKLAQITIDFKNESVQDELENISPLLGGLKKQTPYTVPGGYFESLQYSNAAENNVPGAKVISITSRKWFRYAAAALVIGFVATMAFLLLNKPDRIDPADKSFSWVQKSMKKVSTDEINEFIELANAGNPDAVKTNGKEEINNLLKDVSDKEIQDFLNETQTALPETDDDLIMN